MKENIKSIAIVDDDFRNLIAARIAFRAEFPNAHIHTFESSIEFIHHFGSEQIPFDLVISDMQMEEVDSGKLVAYSSWRWQVPAVIVSGGTNHHKNKFVRVYGFQDGNVDGDKTSVEVWARVIDIIFSDPESSLMISLEMGKLSEPSEDLAKIGMVGSCIF